MQTSGDTMNFKARCRLYAQSLYHGNSQIALRFRLTMLAFDATVILFFVVSSMMEPARWIYAVDYIIALAVILDACARNIASGPNKKWWQGIDTWLDIVVVLSLLASMFINNLSFIRIIRTLRLLRSYQVMRDLSSQWPWFGSHYEVVKSGFNLFAFVFFVSACVFVFEKGVNPEINNYLDAMYFTVTTLTTTGFGDITMKDANGRLLTIVIMVVGVTLFLRLARSIFRPTKVLFPCPDCGLQRHDTDAVHCKHCGRTLNILSEGY